jgi:hypothetical protein
VRDGDFLDFKGVGWFCLCGCCAKGDSSLWSVLPYGSEAYVNVLFKAYLHKNVR